MLKEAVIKKRLGPQNPNGQRISLFIKTTNIFRTVKFGTQQLEWHVVTLWKRRNGMWLDCGREKMFT
jgi:hypothetical protein